MAFGWIGGLVWLVILGGLVWLVITAVQRNSPASANPGSVSEDAVATLKKRFANGEIDAEEYKARLQLLQK